MPLIEHVVDRSNRLVSAQTKNKLGSGAKGLLAAIEDRMHSCDPKVRQEDGSAVLLHTPRTRHDGRSRRAAQPSPGPWAS